jgi:hypothetical protein
MPHPRKHMKLTGDTHPPEVEDDLGAGDEGAPEGAATGSSTGAGSAFGAALSDGWGSTRSLVVSMPARAYIDAAREQVRARPLMTAAAAFFAGFAVAVVTRSR